MEFPVIWRVAQPQRQWENGDRRFWSWVLAVWAQIQPLARIHASALQTSSDTYCKCTSYCSWGVTEAKGRQSYKSSLGTRKSCGQYNVNAYNTTKQNKRTPTINQLCGGFYFAFLLRHWSKSCSLFVTLLLQITFLWVFMLFYLVDVCVQVCATQNLITQALPYLFFYS